MCCEQSLITNNEWMFRTVSVFRQHVAAVNPTLTHREGQVRIALWQSNRNKEKPLIPTLLIMKIEMFED